MGTLTASRRSIVCAAALALIAMAVQAQNQALPAARGFKPPRVAVLEVSRLFESYNKKKDLESRLKAETREEEKKYRDMQTRYRAAQEELKNVQNGSPRHRGLTLLSKELEYDLQNSERDVYRKVRERKLA